MFPLIFICLFGYAVTAPQLRPVSNEPPTPYDFEYKVENSPTNTFFGQNESGDTVGRVVGSYYVLLPDGRLMNVEYSVNGDSGFVPRISFQNQGRAPIQG